jgi:cytochrome P450
MFSARPAAEHSARKRLISHVYSKSYIQSSPVASAQARAIIYDRLLPILDESASGMAAPHGIDIYSTFMAATMDFIAAYIFGLGNGTDFLGAKAYREHFLELYKARNDYGYYDQELPRLTRFCRRLGIPLCPKWADQANRELGQWCRRLCDRMEQRLDAGFQPRNRSADQPVVWDALVTGLRNEEAKHGPQSILYPTALTNFKLSVASELFDHVLAGQETAGLTLTYLSWQLSQSLELQELLRAELLTLFPDMRLTQDGTSAIPDPRQLDALPLLHAVLMETLRLHAPIPGAQPRQTPDSGCRIGPYQLPGGVRIAALAYTLHRDETVFPEPEKWDYTRWLPSCADEEDRKRRSRQFWAFSSGGRMCIGSNFAMHGKLDPSSRSTRQVVY